MKAVLFLSGGVLLASVAFFAACGVNATDNGHMSSGAVYPMFLDSNINGVNDYFEPGTHDAGTTARTTAGAAAVFAMMGHAYQDDDGDGVCDFAQDGSATWHGPGFIDEDNNGLSDYWQSGMPMYGMGNGMLFTDGNGNRINDYMEEQWHMGYGHEFTDGNGDGVCDFAQDGSATWHGPGYIDEDGNGTCDLWQENGRGYGTMMGSGTGSMGMGRY